MTYTDEFSYNFRPLDAACAACPRVVNASHAELDRQGWMLGPREYCPSCAVKVRKARRWSEFMKRNVDKINAAMEQGRLDDPPRVSIAAQMESCEAPF